MAGTTSKTWLGGRLHYQGTRMWSSGWGCSAAAR